MNSQDPEQAHSGLHKWRGFALTASIMLSPEIISKAGNFYGQTGFYGIFLVGLSLFLYILLFLQYQNFFSPRVGFGSNNHLLRSVFGPLPGFFPLTVKIIALLFLATGMLVSAGFVFNEVFLYWFPNFGFASILLICIVLLQWCGQKTVSILQVVFSGLTFAGLLLVIISGFLQTSFYDDDGLSRSELFSADLPSVDVLFIPVLFFLGMDLGLLHPSSGHPDHSSKFKPMKHAIAIMGTFFIFYGLLALAYVPLDKLSQTTISHILIAKSILGGTGRYIMGLVVIFGTLAAIHALLTVIRTQTHIIFKRYGMMTKPAYSQLFILILGITIGMLMAKGLAGHDILEYFINGAFILWLISYAWVPLLNFIAIIRQPDRLNERFSIGLLKQFLIFFAISLSVTILIITSKNYVILLKLIGITVAVGLMVGAVFNLRTRNLTE